MRLLFAGLFLSFSLAPGSPAGAQQTLLVSDDLPNFHMVNARLFRGGQPKDAGYAELKKAGIRTVIDLRDDDDRAERERSLVERAGMRFINIPLGNWSR